jgi:hypothetical protein
MAMACRHAPVHALHRPRTLGTHAEIGNFVQYKSISSGGPPYGTLLQNLEVWCKNLSPAGPLNKPPFCLPLQVPPLNLHSWRPSISPSKRGSHYFLLFSPQSSPPVLPQPDRGKSPSGGGAHCRSPGRTVSIRKRFLSASTFAGRSGTTQAELAAGIQHARVRRRSPARTAGTREANRPPRNHCQAVLPQRCLPPPVCAAPDLVRALLAVAAA